MPRHTHPPDRTPVIEVRHDLQTPWLIQVNPDGTKTLLIVPGLCLEPLVDLVLDLVQDRSDPCRRCMELVEQLRHLPDGPVRAMSIYHLLHMMAGGMGEPPPSASPVEPDTAVEIARAC
ncbi:MULTISPECIES: hypothetical protein [Actinosynnema]|uniref:hypothetical protein n=1 Tax=Actinosynnema TaxID=40566 RepID=UPI0020A2603E|nr:hypothetical protein [Actinosynnema pretiosum]MCP2092687.1 hypothetical protein [Actinosynnema pretiosum]